MKKVQKISLALALCSLSIFAVGCQEKKGNTDKKEANTTTNNANTSEKKETKVALSNELLQKVTDASKAVKSANAKANLTYKFGSSIKQLNTTLDFDFSMVKEPAFIVKLTRHADNDGQKLENDQYITDDKMYVQDAKTKEWMHGTHERLRKVYDGRRKIVNFDSVLEFMSENQANLKVEEKGDVIEVTYEGNDQTSSDSFLKIAKLLTTVIEGNIKEMALENLTAKITIDAKTFIPKEFDVIAKYTKAKDGQTVLTWDFSYKATYTDINGVKEIVIPNEVKNSRNADPK